MSPVRSRPPVMLRAVLESTATPFTTTHYARQASIFVQGDRCDTVMHVEAGLVRLAVTTPNGNEGISGLLGAGAFLGEEALSGLPFRRATATAMTAVDVLVVTTAEMIRLLCTQPAVADHFLAHILERERRLEADLADQLLHSSEQRLARRLIVLAGYGNHRGHGWALPKVSQQLIAEMVGTTRSRVNRFIGKFRRLGFIEEDGGALLVTPALLHALHDDSSVDKGRSRVDYNPHQPEANREDLDSVNGSFTLLGQAIEGSTSDERAVVTSSRRF